MEILHSVLDSVKSVFITTDTWTSRATESYCCEIVTSFLICAIKDSNVFRGINCDVIITLTSLLNDHFCM